MNSPRKTTRQYGAIYRAIRALAATGRTFSRLDLPFPRPAAVANLHDLQERGELQVVTPGTIGRHARPTQYRAGTNLESKI